MIRCQHCWGDHEKDDSKTWVEFQEVKYYTPFLCLCCGKETCSRQWAFGRMCAICDTGICQTNEDYKHPKYKREI